jgi:hypothetical protein
MLNKWEIVINILVQDYDEVRDSHDLLGKYFSDDALCSIKEINKR